MYKTLQQAIQRRNDWQSKGQGDCPWWILDQSQQGGDTCKMLTTFVKVWCIMGGSCKAFAYGGATVAFGGILAKLVKIILKL